MPGELVHEQFENRTNGQSAAAPIEPAHSRALSAPELWHDMLQRLTQLEANQRVLTRAVAELGAIVQNSLLERAATPTLTVPPAKALNEAPAELAGPSEDATRDEEERRPKHRGLHLRRYHDDDEIAVADPVTETAAEAQVVTEPAVVPEGAVVLEAAVVGEAALGAPTHAEAASLHAGEAVVEETSHEEDGGKAPRRSRRLSRRRRRQEQATLESPPEEAYAQFAASPAPAVFEPSPAPLASTPEALHVIEAPQPVEEREPSKSRRGKRRRRHQDNDAVVSPEATAEESTHDKGREESRRQRRRMSRRQRREEREEKPALESSVTEDPYDWLLGQPSPSAPESSPVEPASAVEALRVVEAPQPVAEEREPSKSRRARRARRRQDKDAKAAVAEVPSVETVDDTPLASGPVEQEIELPKRRFSLRRRRESEPTDQSAGNEVTDWLVGLAEAPVAEPAVAEHRAVPEPAVTEFAAPEASQAEAAFGEWGPVEKTEPSKRRFGLRRRQRQDARSENGDANATPFDVLGQPAPYDAAPAPLHIAFAPGNGELPMAQVAVTEFPVAMPEPPVVPPPPAAFLPPPPPPVAEPASADAVPGVGLGASFEPAPPVAGTAATVQGSMPVAPQPIVYTPATVDTAVPAPTTQVNPGALSMPPAPAPTEPVHVAGVPAAPADALPATEATSLPETPTGQEVPPGSSRAMQREEAGYLRAPRPAVSESALENPLSSASMASEILGTSLPPTPVDEHLGEPSPLVISEDLTIRSRGKHRRRRRR